MSGPGQSTLDRAIIGFDRNVLQVLTGQGRAHRPSPARSVPEPELSPTVRRHIAGLMRVNHAGEICAQALYMGQAVMARQAVTRDKMRQSAEEEIDHLQWCRQRIEELGGNTSRLDPFWYTGALSLGLVAGLAGDHWSLGFIAETERQVVEHLQGHLDQLPQADEKSRAILAQMQIDEAQHGDKAAAAGAQALPVAVQSAMRFCARIMTRTAYHI